MHLKEKIMIGNEYKIIVFGVVKYLIMLGIKTSAILLLLLLPPIYFHDLIILRCRSVIIILLQFTAHANLLCTFQTRNGGRGVGVQWQLFQQVWRPDLFSGTLPNRSYHLIRHYCRCHRHIIQYLFYNEVDNE